MAEYTHLYRESEDDTAALESNVIITRGKTLIIRDGKTNKFIAFDSYNDYTARFNGNYLTHEIIFGDLPQKPKFDIDGGDSQQFDTILEAIEAAFIETYNAQPEFIVCDSSNKDKFSRHVIINNHLFANHVEAHHFTNVIVRELLSEDECKYIDFGVNKSTQNFRTVGSNKEGRIKQQMEAPFYDQSAFNPTPEDCFITLYPKELLNRILPAIAPAQKEHSFKAENISDDLMRIVHEKVNPKVWGAMPTQSRGNKLVFRRLRPSFCEVCQRDHDRANMYVCVFSNSIRQFCYQHPDKKSVALWEQVEERNENTELIAEHVHRGQEGHAELFAQIHRDIIYITNLKEGSGYMFNPVNALWEPRCNIQLCALIPKFLEEQFNSYRLTLCNQYSKEADDTKKDKLNKEIKQVTKCIRDAQTRRHIRDVFEMAKSKLFNRAFEYTKNSAVHLLPIAGAQVVDLKTGVPRLRTKEDGFSFECPWEWRDEIDPRVPRYLLDLMNDNAELADFMHRALGYCLTGETGKKSLFIFYGSSGDNGKSKLLNLLEKLLGQFYANVGKSVFIKANERDRHANAHTAHLMPIVGARVIAMSELSESDTLNDGQVKNITGDDALSLRAPNDKEVVQYRPICKPLIITNHKPQFNIKDKAMINRMKYVPFEAQFKTQPTGSQKLADPRLIELLNSDLLGDLGSYLCLGAARYYKEGLQLNDTLIKFKNEAINELDSIAQFIEDECETGDGYEVPASQLFESYCAFCRRSGLTAETMKKFGSDIKEQFQWKKRKAFNVYVGIRLREAEEDDQGLGDL